MKNNSYALITGSANRIGRSISLELAKMGYNIVLHYRSSKKEAEELKEEIETYGRKAELISFDFAKEEDFDTVFKSLNSKKISLEILVNSASDFSNSNLTDSGNSMFHQEMKSNFEGAYLLTKSFARVFKKGIIINMLDTKITKDSTQHFDYLLSKKLLADFTRMAAVALAPDIRVNGICPGLVLPPEGKDEDYLLELAKKIPLKRIGNLTDIQRTVRFLVESDFITGQFIFIDGGDHLSI